MRKRLIKVAATSNPDRVAGAIAGMIREGDEVSVQSVGSSSLIRSVYSICLAAEFLEEDGYASLIFTIESVQIDMGAEEDFVGFRFDIHTSD